MDDQRLSKLPAGAIGAVLGVAFVTRLAALDARSLSAGLFCCSTGWLLGFGLWADRAGSGHLGRMRATMCGFAAPAPHVRS